MRQVFLKAKEISLVINSTGKTENQEPRQAFEHKQYTGFSLSFSQKKKDSIFRERIGSDIEKARLEFRSNFKNEKLGKCNYIV